MFSTPSRAKTALAASFALLASGAFGGTVYHYANGSGKARTADGRTAAFTLSCAAQPSSGDPNVACDVTFEQIANAAGPGVMVRMKAMKDPRLSMTVVGDVGRISGPGTLKATLKGRPVRLRGTVEVTVPALPPGARRGGTGTRIAVRFVGVRGRTFTYDGVCFEGGPVMTSISAP